MNLTPSTVLMIVALVLFVVAATGWTYRKTNLVAAGLALFLLSILVTYVPPARVSINLVLLFAAIVVLAVAAVGRSYRKINLIAVGLALWMLSAQLPGYQVG
ncbi:MAG: hypothetical protein E6J20_10585 [Chloroflexi bacterium]|nr:MAG: hypothetical protein E6J20_10585 [Chloroflexota bacterium]